MSPLQRPFLLLLIQASAGVWLLWFAPERVLGLDSGIAGSVVLSLCAWVAIFLVAKTPVSVGQSVSPSERQAWVGLIFTTIIYVYFLTHIAVLGAAEGVLHNPEARRVGQTLALMTIAWIVLSSMFRQKTSGEVQEDERDRELEGKAGSLGHGALVIGLIGTAVTLGFSPAERLEWANPRMIASIIVNLLVLQALVEHNALVILHWWDQR